MIMAEFVNCIIINGLLLHWKCYFPENATTTAKKSKVFPYSLPSVGPGADPGVQAVSPQVT